MSTTTDVTVAIHRGHGARTLSLQRWFPSLRVDYADEERRDVSLADWFRDDFDFWAFDRRLDSRTGDDFSVVVGGDPQQLASASLQIVTRCQRLLYERNAASADVRFDRVLEAHRALHDVAQPLVRADYDHALDVWQWTLRLDPRASFAVQCAALFHDVERLDTEAFARVEQHAADYQQFKNAHAAAGAERTRALLRRLDIDEAEEVAELVRLHEQRPRAGDGPQSTGNEALQLINDADALSFFSLNSPGFFDYFPPDHAQRKVEYTLRRLSASRRDLLGTMRLRADVARAIAKATANSEFRIQKSEFRKEAEETPDVPSSSSSEF